MCVAVCCSVFDEDRQLQSDFVEWLQRGAVGCSALQCSAVCDITPSLFGSRLYHAERALRYQPSAHGKFRVSYT